MCRKIGNCGTPSQCMKCNQMLIKSCLWVNFSYTFIIVSCNAKTRAFSFQYFLFRKQRICDLSFDACVNFRCGYYCSSEQCGPWSFHKHLLSKFLKFWSEYQFMFIKWYLYKILNSIGSFFVYCIWIISFLNKSLNSQLPESKSICNPSSSSIVFWSGK